MHGQSKRLSWRDSNLRLVAQKIQPLYHRATRPHTKVIDDADCVPLFFDCREKNGQEVAQCEAHMHVIIR